MKSTIVLISLCATLFLSACGPDYYDRAIRNQSSKDVSYVYDGQAEMLPARESKTYSVTLAVHGPSDVSFSGHPKSIVPKADGFDYVFEDAPEIGLIVTNELSVGITISSEYIDTDKNNDTSNDTSFTVNAQTTSTSITIVIYTATPVFTVTPSADSTSPFVVEYKIESGTMTVTISPKPE
jgi:hypothetical protein